MGRMAAENLRVGGLLEELGVDPVAWARPHVRLAGSRVPDADRLAEHVHHTDECLEAPEPWCSCGTDDAMRSHDEAVAQR